MSALTHIVCLECGQEQPPAVMASACPRCGSGWLDARYDYAATANAWRGGIPATRERNLWRYAELLPLDAPDPEITLGEGFTPLVRLHAYERQYDHVGIFVKDERHGPTSSFKDRQAALAVTAMRRAGIRECVLASTGNAGVAYAAYCARAGIKLWLFLTHFVLAEKMREAALYGAEVVKVNGTYDETKAVAAEFARHRGLILDRGARAIPGKESMKTMAFEIAEQLGIARGDGRWIAPDWYLQAVSGGIGPLGVWKGFDELLQMGLIDRMPKLGIIQAAGCAPMVEAFEADLPTAAPVVPRTLITVLATGDPGYAYVQLRQAIQRDGGSMLAIPDGETFAAMRHLASSAGFSVEPATAVAFAGLEVMLRDGTIQPGETVVVNGSGHTFPAEGHILGDRYLHDLQLPLLETSAHPAEPGIADVLRRLDEQVSRASLARTSAPSANGMRRIVMIDDSATDRRLARKMIESTRKFTLLEAANGRDGLKAIFEHRPDLILLDLELPDMAGALVLESIENDPVLRDIPVIIYSGRTLTTDERSRLQMLNSSIIEKSTLSRQEFILRVSQAFQE